MCFVIKKATTSLLVDRCENNNNVKETQQFFNFEVFYLRAQEELEARTGTKMTAAPRSFVWEHFEIFWFWFHVSKIEKTHIFEISDHFANLVRSRIFALGGIQLRYRTWLE